MVRLPVPSAFTRPKARDFACSRFPGACRFVGMSFSASIDVTLSGIRRPRIRTVSARLRSEDVPLVVVGFDHRSSPPELFRRATISAGELTSVLDRVAKSDHLSEAVVVATCQRTEIYVDAVRFHGAISDLRSTFAEHVGLAVDEISDYLVERYEEGACAHLFALASGVESVMLGEGEILGQLARSWRAAQSHGSARTVLNGVFRQALITGKRARNETRVGAGVTSIGTAAVSVAGDLHGKSVLVVGAGEVATKVALAARRAGAKNLSIANRTHKRASELAKRVDGAVASLPEAFDHHDVVFTATTSPVPILDLDAHHPGVVVDLGVPSNVSGTGDVIRLHDVQAFVNSQQTNRLAEVERVNEIVDEEVRRYYADVNARVVAPLVVAMHERADDIRTNELKRFTSRLATLDATQRKTIDELTSAMVAKLFHDPTINLKLAAGTPEGERMAEAVRRLFEI